MKPRWVLVHGQSTYDLPSGAVARFIQRRITQAHTSGEALPLRFSEFGSTDVVTVVVEANTRVLEWPSQ